jgi:hypothetical protein
MHKTIFLFLIVAALGSMTACKRTLPDYGRSAVVKMANNWWVSINSSAFGLQTSTRTFLTTYNASSNSVDSLWVDDLGYIGLKALTTANYSKQTFAATNIANLDQPFGEADSVTIFNGKVITLGGHSKTGVATDSIYFQAMLSDDPGDTLTYAGTARTGFIADDY